SKKHDYDSKGVRARLQDAFKLKSGGKEPYDWQVNVTEAILLGLDCMVIAGTGSGQTMSFVMPLFLEENKNKIVIILSPLNELERDQARWFREMGLSAAAVNGESWAPKLENDIKSRKYQVLITSPEMLLRHAPFRHVISNHKFSKDILAAVVDESHCIPQWGDKFRKENKNVGQMCSLFPSDVPVLATTATVSPEVVLQKSKWSEVA
ncbi:hypothetical protein M422DRAFT_183840, partial [Sphaerobolus stellatus SS14]